MFWVLNYPQTVVEPFNTQSAKSQKKQKNHIRNSFMKKYFLSNFWCVVTVHLKSCHIYTEEQTCFTNGKDNTEEKEKKKKEDEFRGILLLKQILMLFGPRAVNSDLAGRWRQSRWLSASSLFEELAGAVVHQPPELCFR